MTPEELQQIQAIIQATVTTAIAPIEQGQQQITTRLNALEQGQQAIKTEMKQSEQKIMKKLDQLEKLTADYLDGQVQSTKRRLDQIERHLNLT